MGNEVSSEEQQNQEGNSSSFLINKQGFHVLRVSLINDDHDDIDY